MKPEKLEKEVKAMSRLLKGKISIKVVILGKQSAKQQIKTWYIWIRLGKEPAVRETQGMLIF